MQRVHKPKPSLLGTVPDEIRYYVHSQAATESVVMQYTKPRFFSDVVLTAAISCDEQLHDSDDGLDSLWTVPSR
jgi:hypothetical protein